jgi:hypothetical protein
LLLENESVAENIVEQIVSKDAGGAHGRLLSSARTPSCVARASAPRPAIRIERRVAGLIVSKGIPAACAPLALTVTVSPFSTNSEGCLPSSFL